MLLIPVSCVTLAATFHCRYGVRTQRVSELPRVVKAGEAREKLTERQ